MKTEEFVIYSRGLCFASVCTSLSDDEATRRLNIEMPTGISSRWSIHDGCFYDGSLNPMSCEEYSDTHRHILFSC